MASYLKSFEEMAIYADPGSHGQQCRDIFPEGVLEGLSLGYNILDGNGWRPGARGPP